MNKLANGRGVLAGRPFRRRRLWLELLEQRALLSGIALPADSYWVSVERELAESPGADSDLLPSQFETLRLDQARLQSWLSAAPREFTAAAGQHVLLAPTPVGDLARFAIVEAPIMARELQAQFPEIRTYRGQGIDNPAETIRLDVTPAGFHAQVLSPNGAYYVDPYSRLDSLYISYFKRDLPNRPPFTFLEPKDLETWAPRGKGPSGADPLDDSEEPLEEAGDGVIPRGPQARSGSELRTYRLAVAATGEYTQFHGGSVAQAQAAIVTTVNRVVGIYEVELAVRMELVAENSAIIYSNGATDPYTNNDEDRMLEENQENIDRVIGDANYDIGHVFATGGGGIAQLGVVGESGWKAQGVTGSSTPVGDPFDLEFVAHEMGHQFGAEHTFNGTRGSCSGNRIAGSAYEPGSGSTIMSYAGICGADNLQDAADPFFHFDSYEAIQQLVSSPGNAGGVATQTGNSEPTVDGGSDYTIPARTPFLLLADGSDADGQESLTYSWEQRDLGPSQRLEDPDDGSGPLFRALAPAAVPFRVFPQLTSILNGTSVAGERLPTTNRTLNFRVTARDNHGGGGGVDTDDVRITVIDTGEPFAVSSPNSNVSWAGATTQQVAWNVAGTSSGQIAAANVNLLLSVDGGQTFPMILAENTPNDGAEAIVLPSLSQTSQARIKVEAVGNVFFDISDVDFTITEPLYLLDFGDAPDDGTDADYNTLLPDAARHTLGGPFLGGGVDGEPEGQPSSAADGDGADEDGVVLLSPLVRGQAATLQITSSSGGGQLDYFFDFDGDGRFGSSEEEQSSLALKGGVETVAVDVPAEASAGFTYARFRISSAGGLSWSGPSDDGEVEDYRFILFDAAPQLDYGDAPAPYASATEDDGPRHLKLGPSLGALNDVESNALSNAIATGDASDDGVVFPQLLVAGSTINIEVSSLGAGVLDFFFDLDGDGSFGNHANEVFRHQLSGGSELIPVTIPQSSTAGVTYARFRLSTQGSLSSTGFAADGEVEDYRVVILSPVGFVCEAWESFDAVVPPSLPAGWTSLGQADWTIVAGEADSPPNQAFVPDPADRSDSRLRSPGFLLDSSDAQLKFSSDYLLEDGYDGGVLEISVDGGAFTDILQAGGFFVTGGYDDALSDEFDNPLGGRTAWTGDSGGWRETVVDLPPTARGHMVQFQWRMGSDSTIDESGWRLDTIEICGDSALQFDYGDALGSGFGALEADNGARHVIGPLRLGEAVDADDDGQPTSSGDGDDTDADGDDDDGVAFITPVAPGRLAAVDVTASAFGVLNAWIDFNGDEDWQDAGEQVFNDQMVNAGINHLTFAVPDDDAPGAERFARFRVSSQAGLSPAGPAPDGEVEDYAIVVAAPAPTVRSLSVNAPLVDPPDLPQGPSASSWVEQRSDIRVVQVEFSQPVLVAADSLVMTNLGVDSAEPDTIFALTDEHLQLDGQLLTIVFDPYELPDGVYQLEILASVTNLAGQALDGNGDGTGGDSFLLAGDSGNGLLKLAGDFNGDEGVTIFDFPTFSYWFGKPVGVAPAYVDLNVDGGVSIFDFPIFSANFGRHLVLADPVLAISPAPPAAAAVEPRFLAPRFRAPSRADQRVRDAALQALLAEWVDGNQSHK